MSDFVFDSAFAELHSVRNVYHVISEAIKFLTRWPSLAATGPVKQVMSVCGCLLLAGRWASQIILVEKRGVINRSNK